jgi:hypothetical protein
VEKLAISASSNLVNRLYQSVPDHHCYAKSATYGRVQIDEDGTGDVFAIAGLGEEGLQRATLIDVLRIGIRATVGLEAVLEQVPRISCQCVFEAYEWFRTTYSSQALFPS